MSTRTSSPSHAGGPPTLESHAELPPDGECSAGDGPTPWPWDEPDEPSDLDGFAAGAADDDSRWDVFIPDDDEFDPLPDANDFWTTQD